jgi:hypothetical protein
MGCDESALDKVCAWDFKEIQGKTIDAGLSPLSTTSTMRKTMSQKRDMGTQFLSEV